MPRQSRIDAPGALHHIIIRGIERRVIFRDDEDRDNEDRESFLDRLGGIIVMGIFFRTVTNRFYVRKMAI